MFAQLGVTGLLSVWNQTVYAGTHFALYRTALKILARGHVVLKNDLLLFNPATKPAPLTHITHINLVTELAHFTFNALWAVLIDFVDVETHYIRCSIDIKTGKQTGWRLGLTPGWPSIQTSTYHIHYTCQLCHKTCRMSCQWAPGQSSWWETLDWPEVGRPRTHLAIGSGQ